MPENSEPHFSRFNFLDIAPWPVTPPQSGGSLLVDQAVRALARHASVRLFTIGDARFRFPVRSCEVPRADGIAEYRWSTYLGTLLLARSRQAARRPPLGISTALQILRPRQLDLWLQEAQILQVETPWPFYGVFQRLDILRLSRPIAFVVYGCETRVARFSPSRRALFKKIRRQEAYAWSWADVAITFSREDATELMQEHGSPRGRIEVIPPGVDLDRIRPVDEAARKTAKATLGLEGPVALFMGSRHEANIDAARWLVELAPTLAGQVTIVIVGRVGEALGSALPSNVRVTKWVPDAAPYWKAADVALNPIRRGGGVQVKLLEYLAAGLPTVTTPVGARGVEAKPGEHVVYAEDEATFRDAVATLLKDDDLRVRVGAGGRKLVEQNHDWEKVTRRRVEVYDRLLRRVPAWVSPGEWAPLRC